MPQKELCRQSGLANSPSPAMGRAHFVARFELSRLKASGSNEAKKQQEQDDLEHFMRTFVAEGGDPREAEEEWRRTRSKHAAQSERAKAEARRASRCTRAG